MKSAMRGRVWREEPLYCTWSENTCWRCKELWLVGNVVVCSISMNYWGEIEYHNTCSKCQALFSRSDVFGSELQSARCSRKEIIHDQWLWSLTGDGGKLELVKELFSFWNNTSSKVQHVHGENKTLVTHPLHWKFVETIKRIYIDAKETPFSISAF